MDSHTDARWRRPPMRAPKRCRPNGRVVVAHDDSALREAMIVALRTDFYVVVEATSSEEVLAAAGCGAAAPQWGDAHTQHDVIVCDLWLPETQRRVETMPLLQSLELSPPVVLIAVHATESQLEVARRSRAAAVFECPFDLDDLRTVVMNLLPRASA